MNFAQRLIAAVFVAVAMAPPAGVLGLNQEAAEEHVCDCPNPELKIDCPSDRPNCDGTSFWVGEPVDMEITWVGENGALGCVPVSVALWEGLGRCGGSFAEGYSPYNGWGSAQDGTVDDLLTWVYVGRGCPSGWEAEVLSQLIDYRVPEITVSGPFAIAPPMIVPNLHFDCGGHAQIKYSFSVSGVPPGRIYWSQVVTPSRRYVKDSGVVECYGDGQTAYLDGEVNYNGSGSGQFAVNFTDQPGVMLTDDLARVEVHDSFLLRIVYDSGCGLLPLAKMSWTLDAQYVQPPGGTGCGESWTAAGSVSHSPVTTYDPADAYDPGGMPVAPEDVSQGCN